MDLNPPSLWPDRPIVGQKNDSEKSFAVLAIHSVA